MTRPVRWLLAAALGLLVFLALNRLDGLWLGATVFTSDAFYDGFAALATLVMPAFCAGLVVGFFTRHEALTAGAILFALFCIVGFVHPFWRIPEVSPHSAHSGGMHYFLYNPLVALAFGTLGAWVAGQFATGRWTLTDPEPVQPPG